MKGFKHSRMGGWCLVLFAGILLPAEEAALPGFVPWQGCALEGTGREPFPYRTTPVFGEIPWKQPVAMTPLPGSPGHYLLVERYNTAWLLRPDGQRSVFLAFEGQGINAVFHPGYPAKPFVYLRYSSRGVNRLVRYTIDPGPQSHARPGSALPILEWKTVGHRGGGIAFGPDGFLYLATGDARTPGDPDNSGQKTDNLRGSILRIDVGSSDAQTPYTVPEDNPFAGHGTVRPEVWAYGLRNPWRVTFRPGTSELWVADNGDEQWEMITRATRGSNHGWSVFEGAHLFRTGNRLEGPTRVHTPPLVEHPHREMRSVIGGRWYRGSRFPGLRGHYIYGGHVTGKLWSFSLAEGRPSAPRCVADTRAQVVSFAEDPDGELLVVTLDRGILHLEKSPPKQTRPLPKMLSETGLFASTGAHRPAPGLLRYESNLSMFRNGATRERFLAVPPGQTIRVKRAPRKLERLPPVRTRSGLDRFEFPPGSVLVQTFGLPAPGGGSQRVETQVSLNDQGEWRFLSYRWNSDQQDAVLVPEIGSDARIAVSASGTQAWRYPGRAECAACHTQLSMFAPGMHLAQLNRVVDYRALGGKRVNQLEMFRSIGFLPDNFRLPAGDLVMPAPGEATASLADRARAYLHVNCAHCHREAGMGGRATFQALNWMELEHLDLVGARPLVGLPGGNPAEHFLIVPGRPEQSDLYRRMGTLGLGRMPLFGTSRVDREGRALIHEWIQSMEPR